MFLCMTFKTYGFQHLWSIIRLTELSFPCLDPVFMVCKELRCFPTPFTAPSCPFQCFPSVGIINRGFSVAVPGVFERWEIELLDFLRLQIGVRPMSFPRRAVMDQCGAHCSFSPQPPSFRILGGEFSIASFWPVAMSHELLLSLERASPILLLQPAPQSYPDISVELVKNSTRVDRSVVAPPILLPES